MHIHLGAIHFLTTACYIIVFGFIWNFLAVKFHNSVWGQAMSTIYS